MNPIEERIAKAFQEARIRGGKVTPSVAAQIVELSHIKGLTVEDVISGKTPQGISVLWMHRRISGHPTPVHDELDGQRYPLLPFSLLVHDAIKHNQEAAQRWTFPILLRVKENEIDAERLSAAMETAISNHPVFAMHITEDGQQWYENGYRTPYLSARVYSEDGYVYLSLSLNRILGDATSFVLFAQNIWRAYRGEALPHDGYLQYLRKYTEHTRTAQYREHGAWLTKQYGTPDYPLLPTPDAPDGSLPTDGHCTPWVFRPDYADRLVDLSRREHVSPNAFFCLVTTMAIMDYNGTDKAGLTWAYMGRETPEEMHIFGSLHRDIPMRLTKTITKTKTKTEGETLSSPSGATGVFTEATKCGFDPTKGRQSPLPTEALRRELEQGILHSDYPFTLLSPADSPWHSAVNVLVQPSLAEAMAGCPAAFELVPTEPSSDSYCMLDIDITLEPLILTFNYSPRHYAEASIRRFADLIDQNARRMLE